MFLRTVEPLKSIPFFRIVDFVHLVLVLYSLYFYCVLSLPNLLILLVTTRYGRPYLSLSFFLKLIIYL